MELTGRKVPPNRVTRELSYARGRTNWERIVNWDAIGAVGEVVGAFAVVLTLGYLAVQVRQSTKMARSNVRQAFSDSIASMATSLVERDDLARIVQKEFDGETLEPHEKTRLEARCFSAMRQWENIYLQYRDGLVTSGEWTAYRQNLQRLFKNAAYREFWRWSGSMFAPAFREEVDLMLQADMD